MMTRGTVAVLALAAILATLGAIPSADHTTHRVLEMVRPIPWSESLLPFWNPPPMEAWAIRPLSVSLIKAMLSLTAIEGIPSLSLIWFSAFVSLSTLGLASLSWLKRTGMSAVALPATLSCMLLSPTLFSAWMLTELDALGAGLILGGSSLLIKRTDLGWRAGLATACVLGGLLLKESTGLIQFAFLISAAALFEFHHRHSQARRHWIFLGVGVVIWSAMVVLTMDGKSSLVGTSSWLERIPILEHNLAQLVYLATLPGALLIGIGAIYQRIGAGWLRSSLPSMGLLLLLLLPPTVHYSHYEAVYFSPRWVPLLLGAILTLGLFLGLFQRDASTTDRLPQAVILMTWLAFGAAVLGASNPREDMASRLFLAVAPALHGLAWMSLRALGSARTGQRWQALPIGLLVLSLAWTPLASAWNSVVQWRNLQEVDFPAREALVAQDLSSSKVIFNHFSTWLGTQEMEALGWVPDSENPTRLVKAPAWLRNDQLPPMDWGTGLDDLEHDYQTGTQLWVYWLAVRSEMPPEANAQLMGDLTWTRRPMGLFTPINYAHGDNAGAKARRRLLPEHNLAEDMRMTTWNEETPTLLKLSEERGDSIHHEQQNYVLLPTLLPDIGQRLVRGIPWLETYRVEARLFSLQLEQERTSNTE